jgi:hypothetical protein
MATIEDEHGGLYTAWFSTDGNRGVFQVFGPYPFGEAAEIPLVLEGEARTKDEALAKVKETGRKRGWRVTPQKEGP